MLKYLEHIYDTPVYDMYQENLVLFLEERTEFEKVKGIIYKLPTARAAYDEGIKIGFQPLVEDAKTQLERLVQDVTTLLSCK